MKARFEGFYYASVLSVYLVGIFTDETDLGEPIIQKVALKRVVSAELQFLFNQKS